MESFKIKPFIAVMLLISLITTSCSAAKKNTGNEMVKKEEVKVADHDANFEKDILFYVNQHRKSLGLGELKMIDVATQQAYKHSKEMATKAVAFSHDGFDNRIEEIKKKIGFIPASAENVAYGYLSAKAVVEGWLNSPGHKKNIEGNYTLTGIGVANDKSGMIYFTQIFIKQ
jgi:uncharacterized protein YkwD